MPKIATSSGSSKLSGGFGYWHAYVDDVEAHSTPTSPAPRRLARRLQLHKRSRWIIGFALAAMTLVLLTYRRQDSIGWVSRPEKIGRPSQEENGSGAIPGGMDDIWHAPHGGHVDGDSLDHIPPPPLPAPMNDNAWRLNEYGDKFRRQALPPMHPDIASLPSPSSLFPEVSDIASFLHPPTFETFPESRLRDIISEPAATLDEDKSKNGYLPMPDDAYSRTWKKPDQWKGDRGDMRRMQWEGFSSGRSDTWETKEEGKTRKERRDAVKRGFVYAWQKYKDHAWGHDEVKPVSKYPSDPFNNWGASIVDTLDSLLVFGLDDEYKLCRPFVNQLNFHWVGGKDWSKAYISPDSVPNADDDEQASNQVWGTDRDKGVTISVFETTIRYLGGLLGAYDLSGDQLLVDRAVDLATILERAFNTKSGLPAGHMNPGYEHHFLSIGSLSIAEAASISLEFMRLAQVTDNRKWYDLAQRVTDYIEEQVIPRSQKGNLVPLAFPVDGTGDLYGTYAWGGMADSYYEYLIKTYKLLGGGKSAQQYRRIYEQSVDAARQYIFYDITSYDWSPSHKGMLGIGKTDPGGLHVHEIEHLTCFAGGMLGMGSKLLDRQQDMVDAERFTQACYWLSAATPTGLQPEVVEFFEPGFEQWENVTMDGFSYLPPSPGEKAMGLEVEERMKGSPTGSKKVVTRGINRPETIESIFYMYRLTGDKKWQEKGWKMFVSWMTAAKVEGGISSIHDVTKKEYYHSDNMESFMFAETFKYHFLLQSDPDVLSLDDYVLNTEAHPFIANPSIEPGSQKFHTPSSSQDLGTRGQGTDAQKWLRLDHLTRTKRQMNKNGVAVRATTGSGGRGMGGGVGGAFGGGSPEFKPQIPEEFREIMKKKQEERLRGLVAARQD